MKVVTGDKENVLKLVKVGKTTVNTSQERTEWRLYRKMWIVGGRRKLDWRVKRSLAFCLLFQSVMMSRKCEWLLGCRYPEL